MYMAQIEETFSMFQGMCVSQQEQLRPIKEMKAKADKTAVQEEHSPIGSGNVNTATMDISVALPQEPEDSSGYHCWEYTQRTLYPTTETFAQSLLLYP